MSFAVDRFTRAVVFSVALALLGCAREEPATDEAPATPDAQRPLIVYVVSYPLRFMAERIGGSFVRVELPLPAEVDPADWLPDAETVAAYQRADLILRNGAGLARWLELASLPRGRTVDTSASFQEHLMPLEGTTTHAHGRSGAHSHTGFAATTWLDPTLAKLQARAIEAALSRERPEHADAFRAELAALENDLSTLDERLAAVARRLGDTPLLFSHPVYQYLIRRYALNGRALHWEPDTPPAADAWRRLDEMVALHPARWMVWEAEPLEETRRALRAQGIESLVFSPCGNAPREGDFLSVMRRNAAQLERAAPREGEAD